MGPFLRFLQCFGLVNFCNKCSLFYIFKLQYDVSEPKSSPPGPKFGNFVSFFAFFFFTWNELFQFFDIWCFWAHSEVICKKNGTKNNDSFSICRGGRREAWKCFFLLKIVQFFLRNWTRLNILTGCSPWGALIRVLEETEANKGFP